MPGSISQHIAARIVVAATLLVTGCSDVPTRDETSRALTNAERDNLAVEIERSLREELLGVWYPRVVDEEFGGYVTQWDSAWQMQEDQDKMIVTQARHIWTTAKAFEFYPDKKEFLEYAEHGFEFLRDRMWDEVAGGFFTTVTRDGTPKPERAGEIRKTAYGNAFGIYGLAAHFHASGNEEALELAISAFRWLDEHARDPVYGGYFQNLERDGTPVGAETSGIPPKDQNSSIHLLEAFTELYHVWPDSLLRDRLDEMLVIIRDTIAGEKAYLTLFSHADWEPYVPMDRTGTHVRGGPLDHVSFGHDVETAYLMLEAAEALGENPAPTLSRGKAMLDHSLRWGWDGEKGGFYDAGAYTEDSSAVEIVRDGKNWWTQSEGLNTLLLFGDLYPDDPMEYHEKFLTMWSYIDMYIIDHTNGGWYVGGLDMEPENAGAAKSGIWKSAYHNGRAMMNVVNRLRMTPDGMERD